MALVQCASWYPGAQLTSILNGAEEQFVFNLNPSSSDSKYIGLYHNTVGYIWLDGSSYSYNNFPTTADQANGAKNCVLMGYSNAPTPDAWQTSDCSVATSYVCKRPVSGLNICDVWQKKW